MKKLSGYNGFIQVTGPLRQRLQQELEIDKRSAAVLADVCLKALGEITAEIIVRYGAVYIPYLGFFWLRKAKPNRAQARIGTKLDSILFVRFRGTGKWRQRMKAYYAQRGDHEQRTASNRSDVSSATVDALHYRDSSLASDPAGEGHTGDSGVERPDTVAG